MNMLKMCLNPKVIAGLVIVGLGVYVIAPGLLVAALPLLLLAACPLSMLLMGGAMMRGCHAQPKETVASSPEGESTDEVASLRAEVAALRRQVEQTEKTSGTIAISPRGQR